MNVQSAQSYVSLIISLMKHTTVLHTSKSRLDLNVCTYVCLFIAVSQGLTFLDTKLTSVLFCVSVLSLSMCPQACFLGFEFAMKFLNWLAPKL